MENHSCTLKVSMQSSSTWRNRHIKTNYNNSIKKTNWLKQLSMPLARSLLRWTRALYPLRQFPRLRHPSTISSSITSPIFPSRFSLKQLSSRQRALNRLWSKVVHLSKIRHCKAWTSRLGLKRRLKVIQNNTSRKIIRRVKSLIHPSKISILRLKSINSC